MSNRPKRQEVFAWIAAQVEEPNGSDIARNFGCSANTGARLLGEYDERELRRSLSFAACCDGLGTPPLPRSVFLWRRPRPVFNLDKICPPDRNWVL